MTMHTKKFQIEERRRQVADLVAEALTEQEIADRLGVDRTTISKDIKALKLISQQFVYDITKSDFTYYYKQCLDATRLILKKQWEIVNKEHPTKDDLITLKALSDIRETVSSLNNYYNSAPAMHKTPMQMVYHLQNFGIRPKIENNNKKKLKDYEDLDNIDFEKEPTLSEDEKQLLRNGKAMIVGKDDKTGELIIDDDPDMLADDFNGNIVS